MEKHMYAGWTMKNLDQLDDNFKEFVSYVKSECKKSNIQVYLSKGKRVKIAPGVFSTGYFDEHKLAVATKIDLDRFKGTFVHEFCHFLQWRENDPSYIDSTLDNNNKIDIYELFEEWLSYDSEISDEDLDEIVAKIILMEKNCEQRAIKLMRKFDLSIDVDKYIKEANAYLYYHHIVKHERQWYNCQKKPPYYNQEVIDIMPDTLNVNHLAIDSSVFYTIHNAVYQKKKFTQ